MALRSSTARIPSKGYRAFLPDVNGDLGRAAGLGNALGGPSEETPEAATEVKQCPGEDRANTLKDKET